MINEVRSSSLNTTNAEDVPRTASSLSTASAPALSLLLQQKDEKPAGGPAPPTTQRLNLRCLARLQAGHRSLHPLAEEEAHRREGEEVGTTATEERTRRPLLVSSSGSTASASQHCDESGSSGGSPVAEAMAIPLQLWWTTAAAEREGGSLEGARCRKRHRDEAEDGRCPERCALGPTERLPGLLAVLLEEPDTARSDQKSGEEDESRTWVQAAWCLAVVRRTIDEGFPSHRAEEKALAELKLESPQRKAEEGKEPLQEAIPVDPQRGQAAATEPLSSVSEVLMRLEELCGLREGKDTPPTALPSRMHPSSVLRGFYQGGLRHVLLQSVLQKLHEATVQRSTAASSPSPTSAADRVQQLVKGFQSILQRQVRRTAFQCGEPHLTSPPPGSHRFFKQMLRLALLFGELARTVKGFVEWPAEEASTPLSPSFSLLCSSVSDILHGYVWAVQRLVGITDEDERRRHIQQLAEQAGTVLGVLLTRFASPPSLYEQGYQQQQQTTQAGHQSGHTHLLEVAVTEELAALPHHRAAVACDRRVGLPPPEEGGAVGTAMAVLLRRLFPSRSHVLERLRDEEALQRRKEAQGGGTLFHRGAEAWMQLEQLELQREGVAASLMEAAVLDVHPSEPMWLYLKNLLNAMRVEWVRQTRSAVAANEPSVSPTSGQEPSFKAVMIFLHFMSQQLDAYQMHRQLVFPVSYALIRRGRELALNGSSPFFPFTTSTPSVPSSTAPPRKVSTTTAAVASGCSAEDPLAVVGRRAYAALQQLRHPAALAGSHCWQDVVRLYGQRLHSPLLYHRMVLAELCDVTRFTTSASSASPAENVSWFAAQLSRHWAHLEDLVLRLTALEVVVTGEQENRAASTSGSSHGFMAAPQRLHRVVRAALEKSDGRYVSALRDDPRHHSSGLLSAALPFTVSLDTALRQASEAAGIKTGVTAQRSFDVGGAAGAAGLPFADNAAVWSAVTLSEEMAAHDGPLPEGAALFWEGGDSGDGDETTEWWYPRGTLLDSFYAFEFYLYFHPTCFASLAQYLRHPHQRHLAKALAYLHGCLFPLPGLPSPCGEAEPLAPPATLETTYCDIVRRWVLSRAAEGREALPSVSDNAQKDTMEQTATWTSSAHAVESSSWNEEDWSDVEEWEDGVGVDASDAPSTPNPHAGPQLLSLTPSSLAACWLSQDPRLTLFLVHTCVSLLEAQQSTSQRSSSGSGSALLRLIQPQLGIGTTVAAPLPISWLACVTALHHYALSHAESYNVRSSLTNAWQSVPLHATYLLDVYAIPLLCRLTAPLPYYTMWHAPLTATPAETSDATETTDAEAINGAAPLMDGVPFTSAFLVLAMRCSGMLSLPWNVGETLRTLHRFSRLLQELLAPHLSRGPSFQKGVGASSTYDSVGWSQANRKVRLVRRRGLYLPLAAQQRVLQSLGCCVPADTPRYVQLQQRDITKSLDDTSEDPLERGPLDLLNPAERLVDAATLVDVDELNAKEIPLLLAVCLRREGSLAARAESDPALRQQQQVLDRLESCNPSAHPTFQAELLLHRAAAVTQLPPSPCGLLLVVSVYQNLERVLLQRRTAWVEACATAETEEHWEASGGTRTAAVDSSAVSPPPMCTAEDVTVVAVHVRLVHRMVFGFQRQSYVPLWTDAGFRGTGVNGEGSTLWRAQPPMNPPSLSTEDITVDVMRYFNLSSSCCSDGFALFDVWLGYLSHLCRVVLPPPSDGDQHIVSFVPLSQRPPRVATPLSALAFTPKTATGKALQHLPLFESASAPPPEKEKGVKPLFASCEGWRAVHWIEHLHRKRKASSASMSSTRLSAPTQIRVLIGEALADLVVTCAEELVAVSGDALPPPDDTTTTATTSTLYGGFPPPPPPRQERTHRLQFGIDRIHVAHRQSAGGGGGLCWSGNLEPVPGDVLTTAEEEEEVWVEEPVQLEMPLPLAEGPFEDEEDASEVSAARSCRDIPGFILRALSRSLLLPTNVPATGAPTPVYLSPATPSPSAPTRESPPTERSGITKHTEAEPPSAADGARYDAARCWLGLHGLIAFLQRLEAHWTPGSVRDSAVGVALTDLWELADQLLLHLSEL